MKRIVIIFLTLLIFFSCAEKCQLEIISDCDKKFKHKVLSIYPNNIDSVVLSYSKQNKLKSFKYVVQFPVIINNCKPIIDRETIIVSSKYGFKGRCIFTFIKSEGKFNFVGADSTINDF
jgi:hypothetical protein